MRRSSRGMGLVALVTLLAFVGGTAGAASHSDAPLIKQDPQANLTDVYAFVGTKYNNPREKVLNVIVHVRPFSEPGDGAHLRALRRRRALQHPHHRPDERRRRWSATTSRSRLSRSKATRTRTRSSPTAAAPRSGRSSTSATPGRTSRRPTTSRRRAKDGSDRERTIGADDLLTPPPNVGSAHHAAYNDAGRQGGLGRDVSSPPRRLHAADVFAWRSGEVVCAGPREDSFYCRHPGHLRPARPADPRQQRRCRRPRSGRQRRGRLQGLQRPGLSRSRSRSALELPSLRLPTSRVLRRRRPASASTPRVSRQSVTIAATASASR